MRLLVFTSLFPTSTAPGHGSFVRERIERLRGRLGFDYRVVHPVPRYPRLPGRSLAARLSRLPQRESLGGVEVAYPRYFHVPRWGEARQAARVVRGSRDAFQRAVAELRPSLVDAHYLYPDGCAAIVLAREAGLRVLVTARGSDVNVLPGAPAVRAQLRDLLPVASRVLAVSGALADRLAELTGIARERIVVAPNGVDCARFRPDEGPPLRRLVTVGRLVPGKRVDLLVAALATDGGRRLPALVAIGDGPARRSLAAQAARSGVAERVDWRGELSRDDVSRELARGGVFAFPSRSEGWPNAVLEALACGMPVVATAIGGLPEMLAGVLGCRLLPVAAAAGEWAAALAETVAQLEARPEDVRLAARQRAEALGWDRALDTLVRTYTEAT